jgi:hypothetical protein
MGEVVPALTAFFGLYLAKLLSPAREPVTLPRR